MPTFPNARYLMSKVDFDHFGPVTAGSHDAILMLSNRDSGLPAAAAGQVDFVALDRMCHHDPGPDLWLEAAPGHTMGSVVLHARNEAGGALFSGDVWHHPRRYAASFSISGEQDVALGATTRRRLIEGCADSNSLVMTAHFPAPTAGRVVSHRDGFRFQFAED